MSVSSSSWLGLGGESSHEQKACSAILYSDVDLSLGDKKLNNLAALTYNVKSCSTIFNLIEKALRASENSWKTILNAVLLLHTIILYGPEVAIDKAISICRLVHILQNYNSALVKKSSSIFGGSGGIDYGAPVRAAATSLYNILSKDESIRKARYEARTGQESLVPMGESFAEPAGSSHATTAPLGFGQGITTSVGANRSLQQVPGLYEGRPDRYFDDRKDYRQQTTTVQDHQRTRDLQAPSLLDLVFDSNDDGSLTAANLPAPEYLPALEKQRQLEQQLAQQQEELKRLQELQQQQQQQQQQYSAPNYETNDLLSLSTNAPYIQQQYLSPPPIYSTAFVPNQTPQQFNGGSYTNLPNSYPMLSAGQLPMQSPYSMPNSPNIHQPYNMPMPHQQIYGQSYLPHRQQLQQQLPQLPTQQIEINMMTSMFPQSSSLQPPSLPPPPIPPRFP